MDGGKRRRVVVVAVAVAVAVAAVAAALLAIDSRRSHDAVSVGIEPGEALLDAPLRLVVDGARPGEPVRLELSAASADGVRWTGDRVARADDLGAVSVDGGRL